MRLKQELPLYASVLGAMNYKNLNYEIENSFRNDLRRFIPMNYKNLNYEIETDGVGSPLLSLL